MSPGGQVLVPGYEHVPGNHCGSTALRNLLAFHGAEITEEMAFGLGAGACFFYVALEGQSPSRFTNGRAAKLEESFLELTGAPLRMRTDPDPDASWAMARESVDSGRPALLLTDLYYLDHYGKSAHFPGHAVVLAGYDSGEVLLSDTGFEELQKTKLENLAKARHSKQPIFQLDGHMVDLPDGAELDAARPARRHPGRGRARGAGDDRAGTGRVPGPTRAAKARSRDRLVARGRRGLAVVRALPLPGDRAPRHGRRQLPRDVLTVPRRSRLRGRGACLREASGRWTELAEAARLASETDEANPAQWAELGQLTEAVLECETRLWESLAS